MPLFKARKRPKISIVVAFYNMRREAARTLHALTTSYQADIDIDDYEVIAVDSNSTEPLEQGAVESLQRNFSYHYVTSDAPTPNRAMNHGISLARAPLVMCIIDGARIPTPKAIRRSIDSERHFGPSYSMTLGMHLGPDLQCRSLVDGYCQTVEDALLDTVDWMHNGYELYRIAALADSSKGGFFGPLAECNCFTVPARALEDIDGFDERFRSSGGGLINLHVHNQLILHADLRPVMLLGEASFHQFHGGVATNVPLAEHPFQQYAAEYEALLGKRFASQWREPLYYGTLADQARPFLYIPGAG